MIDSSLPIAKTQKIMSEKVQKVVPKVEEKVLDDNLSEREPLAGNRADDTVSWEGYQYSRADVQRAVEDSNEIIFRNDEQFKFEMHDRTNRIMVKLVNTQTDEIIKGIPPEKMLNLVASIWDLVGILVDERA